MKLNRGALLLLLIIGCASCTPFGTTDQETLSVTKTPRIVFPTGQSAPAATATAAVADPAHVVQKTITSISTPLVSGQFQSYIGLVIPPLPEGLILEGSTMIPGVDDHGLDLIKMDENSWTLWFTKISGSTEKVLDVLAVPELEKDEIILTNYCQLNGSDDAEIIAIGQLDQAAYTARFITNEKIRLAWRANGLAGMFEPIQTVKGIECSAEGGFDPQGVIQKYNR
jgi:hypothetical protein